MMKIRRDGAERSGSLGAAFWFFAAAAVLGIAWCNGGCDGPPGDVDRLDAGAELDAAAAADVAELPDAGELDAGELDAGEVDAELPDAPGVFCPPIYDGGPPEC